MTIYRGQLRRNFPVQALVKVPPLLCQVLTKVFHLAQKQAPPVPPATPQGLLSTCSIHGEARDQNPGLLVDNVGK